MKDGILKVLRWLLVLPASFLLSGAAAWLSEKVATLQYVINVIGSPTTIEQYFYAIFANVVYGWVFVSAGTATAPSRRPLVAAILICVLLAVMGYVGYHGTLKSGLSPILALLLIAGYIVGAALAVGMVIIENRSVKSAA